MGEHSQAVIAEFLNITANAVKTRLYSARKRLRKHMGHIEENLNAARPSSDPKFAEQIQRLIRPEALKQKKPWMWSPGIGADVNKSGASWATPLAWARKKGYADIEADLRQADAR